MRKSKWYFAGGLGLGIAALVALLSCCGAARTWNLWGIAGGMIPFLDSQVIAAGADAHARGIDPLRENSSDINRRRVNYPRVWQGLYRVGFKREHAVALGWTTVAALVVGVLVVMPPLTPAAAVWMLSAAFSPAVLLGVERGNTDLLMFGVLALALGTRRDAVKGAAVGATFALKLFPLAGAAFLIGRPAQRAWRVGLPLAAFAALYLAANWNDLKLIGAATPRDCWLSYGRGVWPEMVLRADASWSGVATGAAWAAVIVVIAGAFLWRRQTRRGRDGASDAFLVGAACYVGTFVIGNNFYYRLVFLLLALPQLWEWGSGTGRLKGWSRLALATAMLLLWSARLETWMKSDGAFVSAVGLGQLASWWLFVALCVLLAAALPDWAVGRREEEGARPA